MYVYMHCGGLKLLCLWDTGAQLSMIPNSLLVKLAQHKRIDMHDSDEQIYGVTNHRVKNRGFVQLLIGFPKFRLTPTELPMSMNQNTEHDQGMFALVQRFEVTADNAAQPNVILGCDFMNKFSSYVVHRERNILECLFKNRRNDACIMTATDSGRRYGHLPPPDSDENPTNHRCYGYTEFAMAKIYIQILRYSDPRGVCISKEDQLIPGFMIMHIPCRMSGRVYCKPVVYEPVPRFHRRFGIHQPPLYLPHDKVRRTRDGVEFDIIVHNKNPVPVVIPGGTVLGSISEAVTANGVYAKIPNRQDQELDYLVMATDLSELAANHERRVPLAWLGELCPLCVGPRPTVSVNATTLEPRTEIGIPERAPVEPRVPAPKPKPKPTLEELLAAYPKEVRGPGLIDLIQRGLQPVEEELTGHEQRQLIGLLCEFVDIYAKSESDLGYTDIIQHRIPLKPDDSEPFFQKSRRFPINIREKLITQIKEQEQAGLLRPSSSCWSSPIVPILKTDDSLRICINYQGLNAKTVQNKYPLPQISEIFDALGKAQYFTKMDFISGFYQIGMHPADIHKTAFTVPGLGLYEWLVLPMGLTGSPATFQALLDIVLAGLKFKCAFAYIDDIIVFSETMEEHFAHLRAVFQRIRTAKLKLKLKKCQFGCLRIDFLGHVISSAGIATDALKIDKIVNCRAPTTVKEIQSFLGLSGYYRSFVKGYSKIAYPIIQLLNADVEFEWGEDQQTAFETLKNALVSSPILAYPDMQKPFLLHTDASRVGFGAVLSQLHGKKERPNAYASKSLSPAEKNYGITELEMAAACWAILKFKHYLYGQPFTLVTDHQPLKWVFMAKEQASNRMDRLKLKVAVYITQMDVLYKPGRAHTNADSMSRFFLHGSIPEPHDSAPESRDDSEVPLHYDISTVMTRRRGVESLPARINTEGEMTPEDPLNPGMGGQPLGSTPRKQPNWEVEPSEVKRSQARAADKLNLVLAGFDQQVLEKISAEQQKDWEIWTHVRFHNCEELPEEESNFVASARGYDQTFVSADGILMWSHPSIKRSEGVIVLPRQLRNEVFKIFHDVPWTGSHQGFPRTFEKIASRYYWPGYRQEIKKRCETCRHCAQRKNPRRYTKAEMSCIPLCTEPWQRICSDVMGPLPLTEQGNKYIITFTDYFTRWTEAVALPDQTAKTIVRALVDTVICRYGSPKVILTDKGSNYLSMTFSVVCQMLGIEQVRSSAYHPETDGVSERFNRTLQDALSSYVDAKGTDWDLWLQPCMHALRLSVHRSIGDSPYYILFGRDCKVPMDHELNLPNDMYIDQDDYKLRVLFAFRDAWDTVQGALADMQTRSKHDYDKKSFKGTEDKWIVGQLVDVWRPKKPTEPKKFWKPWRGPYRLVRVEFPNVWLYRLNDPRQRVWGPEHVNNLKHYIKSYIPPLLDRPRTAAEILEGPEDLDTLEEQAHSEPPPVLTRMGSDKGSVPTGEESGEESFILFPELKVPEPESPLRFGGNVPPETKEPLGRKRKRKAPCPETDYKNVFLPGTLVWGKMSGYVAWPGQVVEALECPLSLLHGLEKEYNRCIHFFGDNTYQLLHVRNLQKYEGATVEQRTKCRSAPYRHALAEIEEVYLVKGDLEIQKNLQHSIPSEGPSTMSPGNESTRIF